MARSRSRRYCSSEWSFHLTCFATSLTGFVDSFSVLATHKQLDTKAAEDIAELAVEVRCSALFPSCAS